MITTIDRVSAPGAAPMRRLLHAYLSEAKYETLRNLRAPAFAGPFLLIPIAMYLFFGLLGASGPRSGDVPRGPFLLTGFTVMGIMGPALFGFGLNLALERDQGLLRLKRALPMPKGAYLLAKMLMSAMFAILIAMSLAIVSAFAGSVPITIGQRASVAAVAVAGTLPFSAIGLFIGARVSGRTAPAFVNLVYIPLMYVSGLFFPVPGNIRWIALFSPAFHLNQLALHVTGTPSILGPVINIAALAGVTVLFAGLTVRRLTKA